MAGGGRLAGGGDRQETGGRAAGGHGRPALQLNLVACVIGPISYFK